MDKFLRVGVAWISVEIYHLIHYRGIKYQNYIPMAVCEGDTPGPPAEAPSLLEIDSPIQQKKYNVYHSYNILLREIFVHTHAEIP